MKPADPSPMGTCEISAALQRPISAKARTATVILENLNTAVGDITVLTVSVQASLRAKMPRREPHERHPIAAIPVILWFSSRSLLYEFQDAHAGCLWAHGRQTHWHMF